jgi:hypothetical protein
MKVNELMIGNYLLSSTGEVIKCLMIRQNSDISNLKPIPITEKWLLKFGFKKDVYNCDKTFYFEKDGIRINNYDGFFLNNPNEQVGKRLFIQHVHQLQNLYHALTGEELKHDTTN